MLPERFWNKVEIEGRCWVWTGAITRATGYGRYRIEPETLGAHVVSAREFIGPCPPGHEVMHSCDNKRCVRPLHLSYGTRRDNVRDMMRKGRNSPPPHTPESIAKWRETWRKGRLSRV